MEVEYSLGKEEEEEEKEADFGECIPMDLGGPTTTRCVLFSGSGCNTPGSSADAQMFVLSRIYYYSRERERGEIYGGF